MAKFNLPMKGYPDDLIAQLGLELNALVRRLSGKNPVTRWLKAEMASTDEVRRLIVHRTAVAIHSEASHTADLGSVEFMVGKQFGKEIEEWIEERRAIFAEIELLK